LSASLPTFANNAKVGHPPNPQTWNRYGYVGNSPLSLTDPSGLCPDCNDHDYGHFIAVEAEHSNQCWAWCTPYGGGVSVNDTLNGMSGRGKWPRTHSAVVVGLKVLVQMATGLTKCGYPEAAFRLQIVRGRGLADAHLGAMLRSGMMFLFMEFSDGDNKSRKTCTTFCQDLRVYAPLRFLLMPVRLMVGHVLALSTIPIKVSQCAGVFKARSGLLQGESP
jgi:hypothetical protein